MEEKNAKPNYLVLEPGNIVSLDDNPGEWEVMDYIKDPNGGKPTVKIFCAPSGGGAYRITLEDIDKITFLRKSR